MKLQIALDLVDVDTALAMVEKIADIIDIVEVGTPMIVKDGVAAVRAMKERFPQVTVLADVKIADGGFIESGYAVDAGADIVTVLAIASDPTIQGARDAAHQAGKEIYVDMLSVPDVVARAKELDAMGVDYIGVHTASDVQSLGRTPYEELEQIAKVVKNAKVAAAGGINLDTIGKVKALGADVGIVGSALTKAPDLRRAVESYQAVIKGETK
ncbi:3-hexulose-6-phosphate synthase [Zongyangia hominis]|uniref:3-hexulose-6-phosphate synthase n=1 Tax=Zongyangia hominis TaxID=2763677 RepID=A0A926EE23_9FIRM|nr:3-hexulose-6-phosphate synthase [Zongyangia hominis]MBC8570709.1 orotidine 5'-phosphate decarboxylase [Zongyangia hominis]